MSECDLCGYPVGSARCNAAHELGNSGPAAAVPRPSEVTIGGEHTLQEIEDAHLLAIVSSSQTFEEAAKRLGIEPSTLWRKRVRIINRTPLLLKSDRKT